MKLILFVLLFSSLSGNNPFEVGELLHYNASFGGVPAANAKLKVIGI